MDSLTALWGKVFFPRRVLSKKIMKKGLFVLFVLLGMLEGMAQEPWSLKLELVNPTGKLDDRSYFLATLKNESDTTEYIVSRSPSNHSILCAIYETVDETVDDTCQFRRECFFDFKVQSVYFIKPHEEFKVKLHLCISPVEFINGVLPYNSALTRKIRRVRIMIDDLYFLPYPPIYDLKEMMHADVYSNWLEIDGEEFYRIFRGNVMSSD